MKIHVFLTFLVLSLVLSTSAAVWAQDGSKAEIISIEKTLWKAWQDKDAKPFEKHLTDDSVNISAGGITSGKANVIKDISMGDCDVKGFSFSDWQLHSAGEDTAILTYRASQEGTCGGNVLPGEVYVSSVYVKRGGAWMAASYQETPVPKP